MVNDSIVGIPEILETCGRKKWIFKGPTSKRRERKEEGRGREGEKKGIVKEGRVAPNWGV